MTTERLRYLLEAYLDRRIQREEFHELMAYFQTQHREPRLEEVIEEVLEQATLENPLVPTAEMYRQICQDPRFVASVPKERKFIRYLKTGLWPLSAVATLIFLLFVFPDHPIIRSSQAIKEQVAMENNTVKEEIKPGQKKALLTLADGTRIPLQDLADQQIEAANGTKVSIRNGRFEYQLPVHRQPLSATISTPMGGEYQFMLPDGTKVWLNANSAITYPLAFNGKTREVEMKGEIYFEVVENKQQPFMVKVGDASIKVLGTHFNVSAYPDEPVIRTTLVQGRVQVEEKQHKRLLLPGQQAEIVAEGNDIQVKDVNVEEMLAWKNGYFFFNNERLESVMKKISRWYNVEVHYQGHVANRKLDGTISRMENIQQLLRALEITETAHFKLEGRRIMVQE